MVIKNETPKDTSASSTASEQSSDDSQPHDDKIEQDQTSSGCKTPENQHIEQHDFKNLESNNNSISSWNYYYPATPYYLYEIDSQAESKVGGASEPAAVSHAGQPSATLNMATAAVVEQEVFTSNDLPLQGPYPQAVPHNDLFVNPAFAHMSFLSDGSMVGPSGEIYSPAEYFPSLLVEEPQAVPAVIPVSPQPRESYPGTPPPPSIPGVGKKLRAFCGIFDWFWKSRITFKECHF